MELIVILAVVAGIGYFLYKSFAPKAPVEVVLPEPTPEPAPAPVVEAAKKPAAKKTAVKKAAPAKTTTARKPRTTTKK
jgi:hypothetical protein